MYPCGASEKECHPLLSSFLQNPDLLIKPTTRMLQKPIICNKITTFSPKAAFFVKLYIIFPTIQTRTGHWPHFLSCMEIDEFTGLCHKHGLCHNIAQLADLTIYSICVL